MKENISRHIIDLLKNHDCVVLPNFGGLILKPVGVTLANNKFSPPTKKIAFNPYLKNDDGLLTGVVMTQDNLSYLEAKNEVLKFSNGLGYQLKKEEQVTLEGVGKFHIINQQIKFQPFSTNITSKTSFGLPNIEVNPISRDLLEEKKQKLSERNLGNVQKKKANKRQKSLKLHFSLAFVVLTIGLLSSLIFSNHKAVNKFHQNASFVEMFFNSDTPQLNLTRNIATTSIEPVFYQRENDELGVAQYLNILNDSSPKGFLIIVGSYASESNAKRMENKLFNEGYDSYILPTDKGFFRVGIFASDNFRTATKSLNQFQEQNKNFWMVRNI